MTAGLALGASGAVMTVSRPGVGWGGSALEPILLDLAEPSVSHPPATLVSMHLEPPMLTLAGRQARPGHPSPASPTSASVSSKIHRLQRAGVLEDAWLEALERGGLTGWVRQHPVRTSSGVVRLDLARPAELIAVEIDSRLWHSSEADYRRERRKRFELAKIGYLVFPVTEFDLHERADEVIADLHAAIRRARS